MLLGYSFAKINLYLDILKYREEEGFHDILSLFVPINWADKIFISPQENINHQFTSNDHKLESIPIKYLTIGKALELLKPYAKKYCGLHIKLEKYVPYQAGLGIASSNAVTVLKLVNQIWDCQLDSLKLKELSTQIGSDCSFFWEDKISLISGKGDIIEPLGYKLFLYPLWILKPKAINISTVEAYQNIKEQQYYLKHQLDKSIIEKIKNSTFNFQDLKFLSHNSFYDITKKLFPDFIATIDFLNLSGGIVNMSGSGSSMYIIFPNKELSDNFWKENYCKIQKNFDFMLSIL